MFDMQDLNPVEKMIMKRVVKYMGENGVKYVGIYVDDNGNPAFEVYNEPVKTFTLTQVKSLLSNGNDNANKD
jgi:hypothetical protein